MRILSAPILLLAITIAHGCGKSSDPAPRGDPKAGSGSAIPTAGAIAATAVFVDVTVVSMVDDQELAHQTVLVDGTKIVAIGPTASTPVPATATKIDGAGKWLVPGLVDMHVHLSDGDALLYVANGVTTVRNMWGREDLLALRERARKNDAAYIGPWIYTSGPIVDGDPPIWPGSTAIRDAAEAEAAVAAQKAAGYDFVKVYDGIPLPAYDALAAAAKAANLSLAGHLPRAVSIEHAAASGQRSIEHLTGYLLAAQDATSRAATMKGSERRAELLAHADASKLAALAKQTAALKIANVPTLIVTARMAALDNLEPLLARPENKYVAPFLRATWDPKHDFRSKDMKPADYEQRRASNAFLEKLVKEFVAAGAPVLVGTDAPNPFVVPGFSIHEELARLVAAGLTPYQALRGATAAAADWFAATDFGRITVGARADLVLLDADPLKDIAATTKRTGVMLRGTWMPAASLQSKLDELAKSYAAPAAPGDRFATAPALDVPPGEVVARASYSFRFAGNAAGEERLAIVKTKTGGRVIVAQGAADPPGPKLTSVRLEFDAKDQLVAFALDTDGKKVEVTPKPDQLVDGNLVATMIPFIERAKPGAKTAVTGVLVTNGTQTPVKYAFDRTGKTFAFTAESSFGAAPGTIVLSSDGLPKSIELKAGPVVIEIVRK